MPPAQPEPNMVNQNENAKTSNMIKSPKSFSRRQFIIFAVIFAGLGGLLIFRVFANAPVEGIVHANGSLIQPTGKKEVFLIEDGKLRPVPPEAYETHGFTSEEVRVATEADIKLPVGEPLPLAEGAIVKSRGKTYQIEETDGKIAKRLIEDSEHLGQLNTREADVTGVSSKKLPHDNLPAEKDYSAKQSHPDGTVILSEDGQKFLIEDRQRRPVLSAGVAATHRLDLKNTVAESEGDSALPRGTALQFKEGSLVKGSDDTMYVVEKVKRRFYKGVWSESLVKRPIRNNEAFRAYSYRESEVVPVSNDELGRLRNGKPLPESITAPVQVVIKPAVGQDAKALRDDFVKNYGAKMRHFFPEWFSMELPLNQAERIKRDPRVKEMAGNVLNAMSVPGPKIATRLPQCEDGQDNDGDGLVDWPDDPGCMDGVDDGEYNSPSPTPAPPPAPAPAPPPPPPPPAGQAPVSQSDPSIGGIAKVGETLVGGTGSWANGVNYYSFKWQRCTSDQPEGYGSGCTDISNGNTQNYLLVEADRSFRIRLVVSASNQYGPGSPAASKVTQPVASGTAPAPAPAPVPPSPTTPAPVIKVWQFYGGNTWLYSVDQASRCEVRLQGGGIQAFTPSLGGQYTVTAGNGNLAGQLFCWNGTVGPVTSGWAGPTAPTPPPAPTPSLPAPTINRWNFNFNNSWIYNVSDSNYCEVYLSGGGIQPFTPSLNGTYTVTAGGGGQSGQLKCWNNSIGPTVSGWEGPAAPIPPPAKPTGPKPLPDQYPAITGQTSIGQTLYATSGYWKNGVSSFKYQWYRCSDVDLLGYGVNCAAITSATGSSYRLVEADLGQRMAVKVTASNVYGSTSAGSLATGVVAGVGVASIASEPASPVNTGTNITLKWYMQYGSNCLASSQPSNTQWSGFRNPTGSQTINSINVTTRFYMSCYFQSSTRTRITLEVVVIKSEQPKKPPPTPRPSPMPGPQPSVNLIASPGVSVASGTQVTLTWNSTNTNSCTASSNPNNPQWSGSKDTSNNQSVGALTKTTTFSISCSGAPGTTPAEKAVQVVVTPATATTYQQSSPSLARIGIPQGGGSSAGSVAVVDTGVEKHPLLNVGTGTTFLGGGINCIANDTTPPTQDDRGHGTEVAGVIGATGDGINTPRGVAPGTTIIPVKVAGADGSAKGDDIACGIKWAADKKLPTNLSMTGATKDNNGACDRNDGGVNQMICDAAKNTLVVVAAGNEGANVAGYWPSNVPGVVVATSINDNDGRPGGLGLGTACGDDDRPAAYSNYAEAGFVNRLVAAPSCVFTTGAEASIKYYTEIGAPDVCKKTPSSGVICRLGGTSMAAPIVTAAGGRSSTDPGYMYILPDNGRQYGGLVRP